MLSRNADPFADTQRYSKLDFLSDTQKINVREIRFEVGDELWFQESEDHASSSVTTMPAAVESCATARVACAFAAAAALWVAMFALVI